MTITFVLPFINLTGGIRVLLDYANWLHDAGHAVTVVYPRWPYRFQYTRRQQWDEFKKHWQHDGHVPWFPLRCRLRAVPMIRSAFLSRADVVVAAGWAAAQDVARLPRSRGRKVLIVFHHETGTGPEAHIQAVYELPFYRISFSQSVQASIAARFGCAVHEVVPNGVDTSLFFPDGRPEPRSVLWLYHPDPRKGADDAINALIRLRMRVPDVQVRACGTVAPAWLPSWMPFDFHPDDATLRRKYSAATALLYPSRDEGFGLPPLEAMACACPPVTTDVGAVREYATDGENASVVAVGNVDAMVDRLERHLLDAPFRCQLVANARRTAERHSLARVAPLFRDALARGLASPAN